MVLGIIVSLLIGKHVKIQALLDANTKKLRIKTIALSQEITEREKAEEEVRRTNGATVCWRKMPLMSSGLSI
jgi:fatty acid/phospholipid biosynthesis enzyme